MLMQREKEEKLTFLKAFLLFCVRGVQLSQIEASPAFIISRERDFLNSL
jgi:hypothetical protein